ncbi:hypothetical protein BAUCODRAFT_35018 [Baudoinia panamericana UAMH 10762]|uniref:Uncharacterized protein n=1 Tax=Baudoinia panamericana (strain UAMH 10762) TaxID=717646 RepID=M2MU08_BAUPA|nr:uncharacterized protein BAUCODRAFT_35018 [Baudoinia panamericana UAMH 10762]EMC95023.1 hypothetical protein BAUCODRAFT_35018 [Baudoinia panamericana UAMH 10762]
MTNPPVTVRSRTTATRRRKVIGCFCAASLTVARAKNGISFCRQPKNTDLAQQAGCRRLSSGGFFGARRHRIGHVLQRCEMTVAGGWEKKSATTASANATA